MISGSIPAKFRGIPRNFAEFRRNLAEITSEVKKFRGIPCWRNSVDTLGGTSTYIPHLSGLITIQITATVIPLYTSAELGVTPVRNDTLFAFGLFRRMNGITVFQKLYSSK